MSANVDIAFTLNGVRRELSVPAHLSALQMLRERLGLTGTKYGCGEGECGACTILLDGVSLNSCLLFAVECDGRQVTTVEGLADDPLGRKIEKAFVDAGAVQCGFCTPGMVMQARQLLEKNPRPSRCEIQRGIEGNLCRCTGYVKIIDAIEAATKDELPPAPLPGEGGNGRSLRSGSNKE
ncbi:MAG: (2Fe-2S)-binding protein [Ideonella sp.]|nr:(2Fe-2S)-binding protein [Ideonella sp.]